VAALVNKDLDNDGNIAPSTIPPAALVAWGDWSFGGGDDNQNVRYASAQQLAVLVGLRNLRSSAEEQTDALKLIVEVANALAGAKLTIEGKATPPIEIVSVEPYQFTANGLWYAVNTRIEGFAQFDVLVASK
jgi:hypothetical protein